MATKIILVPALEEATTGETALEREFTFYGRLSDMRQLTKAQGVIRQAQYGLPVHEGELYKGTVRLRRAEDEAGVKYILTTKVRANPTDAQETSVEVTEDLFNQFKLLAADGLVKDRYLFPVENGLVFEVDAFPNGEGGYHEWIKIDLELTEDVKTIPPIPLELTDVIVNTDRSEETQAKIKKLYERYFSTKPSVAPAEPQVEPEVEVQ